MSAPRTRGARYALHELEALIGWPTAPELAVALGVSVSAVDKWRLRGLSHEQADRLAVACGWHPVLVWPEWLEAEVDDRAVRPVRVTPRMAERRAEGLAMAG